jgi:membrane-bound lytic murein transglycosylase B
MRWNTTVKPQTLASNRAATKTGVPMIRVMPSDPHELVKQVAADFDVPAGLLYGIWKIESGCLEGGWGKAEHGWKLAHKMYYRDSDCVEIYGAKWCWRQWKALNTICAQRRPSGSKVCNPHAVRTSYALAMGPMQHLPGYVVAKQSDGSYAWTDRVVDYDGDGVFDPHRLPDAMAATAKFVRRWFDKKNSWRYAADKYFGSQQGGYFVGRPDRPGVRQYWREWCKLHGCTQDAKVATQK